MADDKQPDSILRTIQQKLSVPKNQRNNFGKYNYRSCEDIVEAVKPLLPTGWALILSDEIVNVGDRYYVKATARLIGNKMDVPNGCFIATGWAREAEIKKGMDESQITGAASSYARKYALNGLFCIDDTKDADTQEHVAETPQAQPKRSLPADDAQHGAQPDNSADAARKLYLDIKHRINAATTVQELNTLMKSVGGSLLTIKNQSQDGYEGLMDLANQGRTFLSQVPLDGAPSDSATPFDDEARQ